MSSQVSSNFKILFGSEDEEYSDEGVDISDDPFWNPLKEIIQKYEKIPVPEDS